MGVRERQRKGGREIEDPTSIPVVVAFSLTVYTAYPKGGTGALINDTTASNRALDKLPRTAIVAFETGSICE